MVAVGDVIEIFDPHTRPKKPKWHVCVCSRRLLFLRINTQPLWMPNHPLMAAANTFLEHESYVELRQLLHFGPHAVAIAMRDGKNPLGRMNRTEARLLATTAQGVRTLNQEQKDLIWLNLTEAGYQ